MINSHTKMILTAQKSKNASTQGKVIKITKLSKKQFK